MESFVREKSEKNKKNKKKNSRKTKKNTPPTFSLARGDVQRKLHIVL